MDSSPVIFKASFEILSSNYLDAVYDLTIAYGNANESPVPRKPAPSMTGELQCVMSKSAIIVIITKSSFIQRGVGILLVA